MDVIVFNKSKDQRLKEFQDVLLSGTDSKLVASAIAAHWSFHLELTLDPVGWQALWKIPRERCEHYKLKFPTVVLVEVQNVDFKMHSAFVKVLKVQDSVDFPENHEVNLKNLYPSQQQENAVNAKGIADVLDQLRFFYNHLWRPWDCYDSEDEDWPSTYLESRLELYYDLQQELFCRETAERISKLIAEGREIYSKMEELESNYDEDGDDDMDDNGMSIKAADSAYALLQLHVRLEPIKTELRALENSAMRKLLKQRIARKSEMNDKREPEKYVVLSEQPLGKFLKFLKAVEKISSPANVFKPIHSLQLGLDTAQAGDTFVLSSGIHSVVSSGRLEEGGSIFGIDEELSACIQRPTAGNFVLDICSGILTVQNVLVDPDNVDIAFLVRPRGFLELTNVRVNSTKCTVGIVVLPGGHLRMKHCLVTGCQVGVLCHPGSSVMISNSEIKGCSIGLQVKAFGGTEVKLENVVLSESRHVGIDVVDKNLSSTGSIEILKGLNGFCYADVDMKDNNVDVVIQRHNVILDEDESGYF